MRVFDECDYRREYPKVRSSKLVTCTVLATILESVFENIHHFAIQFFGLFSFLVCRISSFVVWHHEFWLSEILEYFKDPITLVLYPWISRDVSCLLCKSLKNGVGLVVFLSIFFVPWESTQCWIGSLHFRPRSSTILVWVFLFKFLASVLE